jgi:hypothetical protein
MIEEVINKETTPNIPTRTAETFIIILPIILSVSFDRINL